MHDPAVHTSPELAAAHEHLRHAARLFIEHYQIIDYYANHRFAFAAERAYYAVARTTDYPLEVWTSNTEPQRSLRQSIRLAVYKRDGFVCAECGATERLSIDHIVPRFKGGTDDLENLRVLCVSCNSRKGAR